MDLLKRNVRIAGLAQLKHRPLWAPVRLGPSLPIASAQLSDLFTALINLDLECVEQIVSLLASAFESRKTVYCLGNGGSASTASHLATDLVKLTAPPGSPRRLRAMALTESAAMVTAVANDIAYEDIFVEQLKVWLEQGDIVVGISTSGQSRNVLKAIAYANAQGAVTVGITGVRGRGLRDLATLALVIQSTNTQRIEEVSMVAGHLICVRTAERCAGFSGMLAEPASPVRRYPAETR